MDAFTAAITFLGLQAEGDFLSKLKHLLAEEIDENRTLPVFHGGTNFKTVLF